MLPAGPIADRAGHSPAGSCTGRGRWRTGLRCTAGSHTIAGGEMAILSMSNDESEKGINV